MFGNLIIFLTEKNEINLSESKSSSDGNVVSGEVGRLLFSSDVEAVERVTQVLLALLVHFTQQHH